MALAGKILTKVGILALIAKFGKVIVFALIAFFAAFKNKIVGLFRRKKPEQAPETPLATQSEGAGDRQETTL